MKTQGTDERYHPLSISIHWLTFFLMIAVYALIELREIYPKGSDAREAMKMWHFMLGLTVLGLTLVRIVPRVLFRVPPITPPLPATQRFVAEAVHLILFAALIVLPVLGWLVLSAKGKPIPFFGLELPALIGPNKDLAEKLEEIHANLGTLGYFLIGIHAAASLFHHYIVRDNSLRRILPKRCSPNSK